MENLDIPYFEHQLGAGEVVGSLGAIDGLVGEDDIAEALDRIPRLDDDDLRWQVRLIRGAVRARQVINDRGRVAGDPAIAHASDPGRVPVAPDQLSDLAHVVVAEMDDASVVDPHSGEPTWLTLSLLPDGHHTRLGLVSNGYYDGRVGIAAAQQWGSVPGVGGPWPGPALDVAAPVLATIAHADDYVRFRYLRNLGLGFNGVGGLLRLLALSVGDPATTERQATVRDELLERFPAELIARDRTLDMIGGVAGLVRPLRGSGEATARQSRGGTACPCSRAPGRGAVP